MTNCMYLDLRAEMILANQCLCHTNNTCKNYGCKRTECPAHINFKIDYNDD
jgi:hypothetical protein